MILSILICTVEERIPRFTKLFEFLKKQNPFNDVEILFKRDNKQISVGKKRQLLLEQAKGEFIVFIDDDDWISDDYIKTIRETIIKNKGIDCIGFKIHCLFDGISQEIANASNKYDQWADNVDGFRYVRTIYHKTPVRRSHALKIGFPDKRFAEDHDYSMRLKKSGLLKKEAYLDKIMYYYRYTSEPHNKKYGIKY